MCYRDSVCVIAIAIFENLSLSRDKINAEITPLFFNLKINTFQCFCVPRGFLEEKNIIYVLDLYYCTPQSHDKFWFIYVITQQLCENYFKLINGLALADTFNSSLQVSYVCVYLSVILLLLFIFIFGVSSSFGFLPVSSCKPILSYYDHKDRNPMDSYLVNKVASVMHQDCIWGNIFKMAWNWHETNSFYAFPHGTRHP